MKKNKGIPYIIKRTPNLGIFVAYIRIPDDHPFATIDNYDDIPLDAHGGITFRENITKEKDDWHGFSKGVWIGWDYGHLGDLIPYVGEIKIPRPPFLVKFEHEWKFEEVEREVYKVINQLLTYEKKG